MARVCTEWYPRPDKPEKAGFYMEPNLKNNLDILVKNITKDWDFTILITGGGMVRVGKSFIAAQIACYLAYQVWKVHKKKTLFNLNDCFVFRGTELIKKGHHLGQNAPYSPLVFDEAGADLEGKKIMSASTKMALDYFRECGQYNLFNILVIPEFFDLPTSIALTRSIFLIDVSFNADLEGNFIRGYFKFYNQRYKKYLYMYGKKERNYNAYRSSFGGRFYNTFPLPIEQYKQMKIDALLSREIDKKKSTNRDVLLPYFIYYLINKTRVSRRELSRVFEEDFNIKISHQTIGDMYNQADSLINEKNLEKKSKFDELPIQYGQMVVNSSPNNNKFSVIEPLINQ